MSKIYFYGGAGMVTGSNFLLETPETKLLIDCGLLQGAHTCDASNWSAFAYNLHTIKTLVVTHAHIDHIGRIPRLVKEGFRGTIYSTAATKALAEPLLHDALELLEADARRCKEEPLYSKDHVAQALRQWKGLTYHEVVELQGCTLELLNSGHILGASMVKITRGTKSIVFTGDLGPGTSPLLSPCEDVAGAQFLVMESVYGDRVRQKGEDRLGELEDLIEGAAQKNGTLLIPAFSTERTQDLLFEIRDLMMRKKVPSMPVYVDSPLAEAITHAFVREPDFFAPEIAARIKAGENIFAFPELRFVEDVEESKKINGHTGPKVILAGSGMSNGGRVQGHELSVLPDPNSTLLIVGYQAPGSIGRRLAEGASYVDIRGERVPVRAQVAALYGYSAHMDSEALLEFVNKAARDIRHVFVVEGEPAAAGFLTQRVRDYLGVNATAPEAGDIAEIDL
ncbi:MAG: MBL fold metallo-hydrolase [Patescibacteria group bacterium]|nr:MBL fold metallo-hydrolase [Patescibacteria group bacterium]